MQSRAKLKNAAIAAKSVALPKIPDELINQSVTGPSIVSCSRSLGLSASFTISARSALATD